MDQTQTIAPELGGHSLIGGRAVPGTGRTVHGQDPSQNAQLEPGYTLIDTDQLAQATAAAAEAFPSFSALAPEERALFLEGIAAKLEASREAIIDRACRESGLPSARITGELGRTMGQLRLFASVVRQGDHHRARIDPALPERTPLPRPDIRQRHLPLGPVAVFGASNFPLAFSTAGGDTASALAAGCPVVFKAHNAHPGTGELVGRAITETIAEHGLHPGVFSLVYGAGSEIGQALAADPRIHAIGFTGSRQAGLALVATAAARPVPIPVYAEMSSINPVVVLPGALEGDVEQLAQGFVTSLTGSSGQLCTAPGLVFLPAGAAGDAFAASVARLVDAATGQTMLTRGIADSWQEGVTALSEQDGVERLARGADGDTGNAPGPQVLGSTVAELEANPVLHEEIFGSASLMIRFDSPEQLIRAFGGLEGQLTATVQLAESDHPLAAELLPVLEQRAGRVLFNGWPTGVDVGDAIVHGGPFPATSDSRTTSVGSLAIERFLRPVAYQNIPDALLPEALREANPWGLTRRVDGTLRSPGAN